MNKKILLIFFILLNFYSLNCQEDKTITHVFSGTFGQGLNFAFFDCYYDSQKTVLPVLFFEFNFKYDYTFLKEINYRYSLGFNLSFGDSLNVGGIDTVSPSLGSPYIIYTLAPYIFFNRIDNKFSFVNIVGNGSLKKYAYFELGLLISFVNFYARTQFYDTWDDWYYITGLIGPYMFVGGQFMTTKFVGEQLKEVEISHIFGMFAQCSFDIGKYNDKLYSTMQAVYCYLSIGVEYRIGGIIRR